jgi:hypothetical protein
MAVYTITLTQKGWTGETTAFYYDTVASKFFADADCLGEINGITPPTQECYRFDGFFAANSATAPGDQYIDAAGKFTDAFYALAITANKTIYALGTLVSYKLTLSDNSGTGGDGLLYYRINGGGYFRDYLCESEPVQKFTAPTRTGYEFKGYYSSTSSTVQYTNPDGTYTDTFTALTLTAAKTIYAQWLAPYKITIGAQSGTGGTTEFYFGSISGKFYATTDCDGESITTIKPHTRETFTLLGFYTTKDASGVLRVDYSGFIAPDWIPTAAVTIYAVWEQVSWKITLNKSSGTGGTDVLYAQLGGGWFTFDDQQEDGAHFIETPTRPGYAFKGYYASTNANAVQYVDKDGAITTEGFELAITAAKTFYAQWQVCHKITLNNNGGEGEEALWYNPVDQVFYNRDTCTWFDEVTWVWPPERECYLFMGYFNAANGTTLYIEEWGGFTEDLYALSITGAKTFYAQWQRVSYKMTLDGNGGENGTAAVYYDGKENKYYQDHELRWPLSVIVIPKSQGRQFLGYYSSATGGSRYINEKGEFLVAGVLAEDLTLYARWAGLKNTLTFNYAGGTGTVISKTVAYGEAVGTLPQGTMERAEFDGWYIDGEPITAATVWNWQEDKVAVAKYIKAFGSVFDYFGYASADLVPIASASGDTYHRVTAHHYGKAASGVNERGGIWRNPSVTYLVKRNTTVSAVLGRAFAGTSGRSGYMITAVAVETVVGQFPTVTIAATANEGRDAINKFSVSIPVVARSKAQNLLDAISGGGILQRLTMSANCDAVVLEENLMPCASDIVNGRFEVSAETIAPNSDAPPAAANGFTTTDVPESMRDGDYMRYSLTARKEMT